jgi:hypothetical protein
VEELSFGPQADDVLTELEQDPSRAELLEALNRSLDLLAADPGDARCRLRRYQNIGVWGMLASPRGMPSWLITWEPIEGVGIVVHTITLDP